MRNSQNLIPTKGISSLSDRLSLLKVVIFTLVGGTSKTILYNIKDLQEQLQSSISARGAGKIVRMCEKKIISISIQKRLEVWVIRSEWGTGTRLNKHNKKLWKIREYIWQKICNSSNILRSLWQRDKGCGWISRTIKTRNTIEGHA